MIWNIFILSFAVGFSGAITPGPLLAANIGEVSRRGFWTSPVLVTGHSLAELLMVLALVMGLGGWLSGGLVPRAVGIAGGGFLIAMGASMVKGAHSMEMGGHSAVRGDRFPLLTGALVSVANPFWLLWWATVGSAYILSSLSLGALGVAAFFIGHILSDYVWYGAVALGISSGREVITRHVYRGLILGCGVFLILMGGGFGYWGVTGSWPLW